MIILAMDEAGRGPLAWPVRVGMVHETNPSAYLEYYKDSKALTPKKREAAYEILTQDSSLLRADGSADAQFIDEYGIIAALRQAFSDAYHDLLPQLKKYYGRTISPKEILLRIDGNHKFWLDKALGVSCETIIKWDALIPLISAASIVAKVRRDAYMTRIAAQYPLWNFEKHKGYGTLSHRQTIALHWPSDLHRISYCQNILGIMSSTRL